MQFSCSVWLSVPFGRQHHQWWTDDASVVMQHFLLVAYAMIAGEGDVGCFMNQMISRKILVVLKERTSLSQHVRHSVILFLLS